MHGASCASCCPRSAAGTERREMQGDQELHGCTDDASQLLPWYVNGTLAPDDARRVETHLAGCEACRAELRDQQQLRGLMRTPAQVEYAPQAGWRRLLARIDADRAGDDAQRPAAMPPAAVRARSRTTAWLTAAVLVQAVALAALAGAGLVGGPPPGASRRRTWLSRPRRRTR